MLSDGLQASQVVLGAISHYCVGIAIKWDVHPIQWVISTGVAIEFKGLRFVLTADHILKEGPWEPMDLQLLTPSPGGLPISDAGTLPTWRKSIRPDIGGPVGNAFLDLAVIPFKTPPDLLYFPIQQDRYTAPATGNRVFICGYPRCKSHDVQLANAAITYAAYPDFQCATVIDSSPSEPHELLIDYPTQLGVPPPRGFSGSMVWRDEGNCGTLQEFGTSLNVAPAGIITGHDRAGEFLRVTKIEQVLQFIENVDLECRASYSRTLSSQ